MRIPELSNRLRSAVGFVRGGFFADVGTDHAHLPVYLYNTGRICGAVASDINQGPLAIARANIDENGAAAGVVTQLSDGLAKLERYHPRDIAIFGREAVAQSCSIDIEGDLCIVTHLTQCFEFG